MSFEALIGVVASAILGLSFLQERRLSRMEGRLNGIMSDLLARMQNLETRQGDLDKDIKGLPCHQSGWRGSHQQELYTGEKGC